MSGTLNGKSVAILATDGFEQSELEVPKKVLETAGAQVDVVAPHAGAIQGFRHFDRGSVVDVDHALGEVSAKDYDALVLPGGVFNPDALRINEEATRFVREFFAEKKPVGAICHGGWTLIDAGVVDGRTMTSVRSIRTDLVNAGANVVDEEVVVDDGLVTSRTPEDLEAFCGKLVEEIGEGSHAGQARRHDDADAVDERAARTVSATRGAGAPAAPAGGGEQPVGAAAGAADARSEHGAAEPAARGIV